MTDVKRVIEEALDTFSLDTVLAELERAIASKAERVLEAERNRGTRRSASQAWSKARSLVGGARHEVSGLDLELP